MGETPGLPQRLPLHSASSHELGSQLFVGSAMDVDSNPRGKLSLLGSRAQRAAVTVGLSIPLPITDVSGTVRGLESL